MKGLGDILDIILDTLMKRDRALIEIEREYHTWLFNICGLHDCPFVLTKPAPSNVFAIAGVNPSASLGVRALPESFLPAVFRPGSSDRRRSIMAKKLTSKFGERIMRGTVEVRSAAFDCIAPAGQVNRQQPSRGNNAFDDAKVVQLDTVAAATDVPCVGAKQQARKKHAFQLRVDGPTCEFIDQLVLRLDADDRSELIRAAVRAYEVAWYEYDGNFTLPTAEVPTNASDVSTVADEDNTRNVQSSSKSHPMKRIKVALFNRTMQRIDHLRELTGAASRADVIRFALCVLDAKLSADEEAVAAGTARMAAGGNSDV